MPPNLEKKEGLSPWNVGETPGDENASAMRDGILRKYSRRKRIHEPGSPVRKGGVVHFPFFTPILALLLGLWAEEGRAPQSSTRDNH